jgi:hypothetical protein
MKFFSSLMACAAGLFATADSGVEGKAATKWGVCDMAKFQATYFHDKKCARKNVKYTKRRGKIPKRYWKFFDGSCRYRKKFLCSATGIKIQKWRYNKKGLKCQGKARWTKVIAFKTCTKGRWRGALIVTGGVKAGAKPAPAKPKKAEKKVVADKKKLKVDKEKLAKDT